MNLLKSGNWFLKLELFLTVCCLEWIGKESLEIPTSLTCFWGSWTPHIVSWVDFKSWKIGLECLIPKQKLECCFAKFADHRICWHKKEKFLVACGSLKPWVVCWNCAFSNLEKNYTKGQPYIVFVQFPNFHNGFQILVLSRISLVFVSNVVAAIARGITS